MEFLCYHRDRPGSAALRDELLEEHWSYMDRYAAEMIARGPTLVGDAATGSVHIVDVPDPTAARTFAFDEPNYQAGVYRDVLVRRWHNALGRTMWDFRAAGPVATDTWCSASARAGRRPCGAVRRGRADRVRASAVR
ncbi:YciI family protein [Micromonospora sp. M12]